MVGFPTGSVAAALGADPDLAAEVRDRFGAGGVAVLDAGQGVQHDGGLGPGAAASEGSLVTLIARPSLLVGERRLAVPLARTWQARLLPYASRLVTSARAVGRVEVGSDPAPPRLLGSAVLVAADVAVTSSAVADAVAAVLGRGWRRASSPSGRPGCRTGRGST